jgi:hypothetical protein
MNMALKNPAQTGLSNALIQPHQAFEELDGINRLIDWATIVKLHTHTWFDKGGGREPVLYSA